jgi:hypothetical protein
LTVIRLLAERSVPADRAAVSAAGGFDVADRLQRGQTLWIGFDYDAELDQRVVRFKSVLGIFLDEFPIAH